MITLLMILGCLLLVLGVPISIIATIVFAVKKKKVKIPAICIPVSLVLSLSCLIVGSAMYSKTDEYKEASAKAKEEQAEKERKEQAAEEKRLEEERLAKEQEKKPKKRKLRKRRQSRSKRRKRKKHPRPKKKKNLHPIQLRKFKKPKRPRKSITRPKAGLSRFQ